MDSTLISTRPDEGTLSLSRARRAALGSFAGAVVDWYDFLLYGITAALVFNREFFPQVSPAMGTLAAFATFGVGFLFRPLGGVIFGHFGDRLGRKRMLMLTVWDDGHRDSLDWYSSFILDHWVVGTYFAGDTACHSGICRRRRMGRRGVAFR
ncbi:shikimate transporter [Escherichia coli]|uniref:Shikimate transporter n=1 Tax=Escherichia coli TaxID=562 RepID=A0A376ZIW6_ECOLX|nr:shikimate transporter [Escherichia coli]